MSLLLDKIVSLHVYSMHCSFITNLSNVSLALEKMPQDSLFVVLRDSHDVITNIHQAKVYNDHVGLYSSLVEFRKTFDKLISKSDEGAIVVSSEAQCCVTALGRVQPGDLFAEDGTRTGYACTSDSPGCVWEGEEKSQPWNNFTEDLS